MMVRAALHHLRRLNNDRIGAHQALFTFIIGLGLSLGPPAFAARLAQDCGAILATNDNRSTRTAAAFTETLDVVIMVHPHRAFDLAGVTTQFNAEVIAQVTAQPVVILQGFEEAPCRREYTNVTLPIDVPPVPSKVIPSEDGEFNARGLELKDNTRIGLLGGYVRQCHLSAFESLTAEIRRRGLRNVTIVVPLRGTYVATGWWGAGKSGAHPSVYVFEADDKPSLSTLDAVKYRHAAVHDPYLFFAALRDHEGHPILANQSERHAALRRDYFDAYTSDDSSGSLTTELRFVGETAEFRLL